jgi:hypothetical protein
MLNQVYSYAVLFEFSIHVNGCLLWIVDQHKIVINRPMYIRYGRTRRSNFILQAWIFVLIDFLSYQSLVDTAGYNFTTLLNDNTHFCTMTVSIGTVSYWCLIGIGRQVTHSHAHAQNTCAHTNTHTHRSCILNRSVWLRHDMICMKRIDFVNYGEYIQSIDGYNIDNCNQSRSRLLLKLVNVRRWPFGTRC